MKPAERPLRPLLTGIGLVVLLFISTAWLTFRDSSADPEQKYRLAHSHRALAYRLTAGDDTVFRVHPGYDHIALITNLDLTPGMHPTNNLEVDYAFTVDIRHTDGSPIRSETFWERTRWSRWRDVRSGVRMSAAFYLHENAVPADSRITTIYLDESRDCDILVSIRLHNPPGATASLRVYHPEDAGGSGEINPLRFLSKRFKSRLARHNLFNHHYRDSEVKHSIAGAWKQVPAEGRSGWDYETRNLFLYDRPIPLSGEPVPDRKTIEPGKPLDLAIRAPARITIRGKSPAACRAVIQSEDGSSRERTLTMDAQHPADIDIPGAGRCFVTLFSEETPVQIETIHVDPASARLDIAPDNPDQPWFGKTRFYDILPESHGAPVTLKLEKTTTGDQRPVRISCRLPGMTRGQDNDVPFQVDVQYMNSEGNLIGENTLAGRSSSSRCARYADAKACLFPEERPSYPVRFIIFPPDAAETVRLYSDLPVEAAFFIHVNSEHRVTRIAGGEAMDSGRTTGFSSGDGPREWFYFRPVNHDDLAARGRIRTIGVPSGFRERAVESPDAAPDTRLAETIFPVHPGPRDYLFSEQADAVSENGAVEFFGREDAVFTLSETDSRTRPLRFRYCLQPGDSPLIRVDIDDITAQYFRPATLEGAFEIPQIAAGDHTIRFRSASAADRFYMQLIPGLSMDRKILKSRTVFRLDPGKSMRLVLNKTEWTDTGVNIMAYRDADASGDLRIDVTADSLPVPLSGHTAHEMTTKSIAFIAGRPAKTGDGTPFLRNGRLLSAPVRLFFPLHDDLPPARYPLTIQSQSDSAVYLRFFVMKSADGQDA